MYRMNKFQAIFLHVQYENAKWRSLALFNTNFAVRKLQLPSPQLF